MLHPSATTWGQGLVHPVVERLSNEPVRAPHLLVCARMRHGGVGDLDVVLGGENLKELGRGLPLVVGDDLVRDAEPINGPLKKEMVFSAMISLTALALVHLVNLSTATNTSGSRSQILGACRSGEPPFGKGTGDQRSSAAYKSAHGFSGPSIGTLCSGEQSTWRLGWL